MRFKTEIEVVSADEFDRVVTQYAEWNERQTKRIVELEQDFQTYREQVETAAVGQTDWKKQCEDLLSERDELKVNHEDSVKFATHWREKFDEVAKDAAYWKDRFNEMCDEHAKADSHRNEMVERVNQQAQALQKAARLNLQLKEEVERLRAELNGVT